MTNLRSRVIRLAHEKPELRGYLLPLLKEAATIPGLPSGWTAHSKKEASWNPGGHRYDIEDRGRGWEIDHFNTEGRTAVRMKVGDLPVSVKRTKLVPDSRGDGDVARFVHAFDAADAAMAYHKATG